jgi:hypothetical protein
MGNSTAHGFPRRALVDGDMSSVRRLTPERGGEVAGQSSESFADLLLAAAALQT